MPAPVSVSGAFFSAYDEARAEGRKDAEEARRADDQVIKNDANIRAWQYQDIQKLYADQSAKRFQWEEEDRARRMKLTVAGEDLEMLRDQAAKNDLATKIELQGIQLRARESVRQKGFNFVDRWTAALESGDSAGLATLATEGTGLIDEIEKAWGGDPVLKQGASLIGSLISGTPQGRAAIGAMTAHRGLEQLQRFQASLPADEAQEFETLYGRTIDGLGRGIPADVAPIISGFQKRMERGIPTYRDKATEARKAEATRIEATTAVSAQNQILSDPNSDAEAKAAALRKKEEALMKLGESFEFGTIQPDGSWKGSGRRNEPAAPAVGPQASAPPAPRTAPGNSLLPPIDAIVAGGSWKDAPPPATDQTPPFAPQSPQSLSATVPAPLSAGQAGPPANQSVRITIGDAAFRALGVPMVARINAATTKAVMGDPSQAEGLLEEVGRRSSDMTLPDSGRQQLNDLYQSLQRLIGKPVASQPAGAAPPSPTDVAETLRAILRVQ